MIEPEIRIKIFFSQVMETDLSGRKRPRGILDMCVDYAAFKSHVKKPILTRAKFGLRNLIIKSQGKCVCGHVDTKTVIIRRLFHRLGCKTSNLHITGFLLFCSLK